MYEEIDIPFLDASTHLYERVGPSVRPLVGRSVRNAFVKIDEKWPFYDFDSAL